MTVFSDVLVVIRICKNLPLPEDAKCLVLISHQGQLARLIVIKAHLTTMHMGLQSTLAEVRRCW